MKSFVRIETRTGRSRDKNVRESIILRPCFIASCKDLMQKGGRFYAVLDEETGMWYTDASKVLEVVDRKLYSEFNKLADHKIESTNTVLTKDEKQLIAQSMDVSSTGVLADFNRWLRNLPPNLNYKPLDDYITFKSEEVKPEDYRSKRLSYDLYDGDYSSYDEIMSVLYDEDNRRKIEWMIGSVFAGDSRYIEKMAVLYGKPGSGKSTVLDIIKQLFEGYWSIFVADDLVSKSKQFATAFFRDNPLVAIQDDGSMSRIDDPVINEIISHKEIQINEKKKEQYSLKIKTILFLATNESVDLNNEMGGMSRRLLDIYPSNRKLPVTKYRQLVKNIKYELGAIAKHCLDVYNSMGKEYYSNYRPDTMINKTNYIRNFILDDYEEFKEKDPITKKELFDMYKSYVQINNIKYQLDIMKFTEQIQLYYKEYHTEPTRINGELRRNVFKGFKGFEVDQINEIEKEENAKPYTWLSLECDKSKFDKVAKNWKAQYSKHDGTPKRKWENVNTVLKDLDTSQEHYVEVPLEHIIFDFDIRDPETGEKDPKRNIEEASKYPATYAEYSRSGGGLHLHYIYAGNVDDLANILDDHVEIKHGSTGKLLKLRRKLSKCNDLDIATISGLPVKERKKVGVNENYVMNEKHLRNMIERNLRKEIHGATKPSIDFINKLLDDAYASGEPYNVSDLRGAIVAFANNSTHQAENCLKIVANMKFTSEVVQPEIKKEEVKFKHDAIIFFDCEVFPNFFCVCYKPQGENEKVVQLINPTSEDIKKLLEYKLIGFNNKDYDNYILYARCYYSYNNEQLYNLSQKIIKREKVGFNQARNLSYADVYDFASAANKKGLKKWEIELGISHVENSYPWDEPLPEAAWQEVADYCSNDVIATEAVFNHLKSDYIAREILADLSGLPVNDGTNRHTTKIILGSVNNPLAKREFVYTDLSKDFPGYKFEAGKSYYRGEIVGEGGYVYAEPGCYTDVALLDIASMHPSSITALNLFGPYTKNFNDIKDARLAIKHKDFAKARKMLDGKLAKYLDDEENIKNLPNALKTAINSVYGMTSSRTEFDLKDPRNKDNIVAKRGALFMVDLKHAVQEKGFTVAHIKTDSIKIPNATPAIIEFVMEYGKKWGYTFEHEATYKRMCLVNDAVYIALYPDNHWTATGTQFQVPYVYKTLFTKEDIIFSDLCIAMSTKTSFHLDFNEDLPEGEHNYIFAGKVGNFCPVKEGCGGGQLMRVQVVNGETKYYAATGSKGYRWKEAEVIKANGLEDQIDFSYFDKLADAARKEIEKYTDFEWFANPNSNNELVPFKG